MEKSIHDYFGWPIPIEKLRSMPTKRILTYFKSKRGWEHHGKCKVGGETLYRSNQERTEGRLIIEYFDEIRKILNEREHID